MKYLIEKNVNPGEKVGTGYSYDNRKNTTGEVASLYQEVTKSGTHAGFCWVTESGAIRNA